MGYGQKTLDSRSNQKTRSTPQGPACGDGPQHSFEENPKGSKGFGQNRSTSEIGANP